MTNTPRLGENLTIEDYIRESNLIEGVDNPKEIDQSLEAWNYLKGAPELDTATILTTHGLVMRNLLGYRERGNLREVQVWVGNRKCPHPLAVPDLLRFWLEDMANYKLLNPKNQHVRFEKIHPFVDGNGRSGRMFMWWHEMMLGQILTYIPFSRRWSYYSWFEDGPAMETHSI